LTQQPHNNPILDVLDTAADFRRFSGALEGGKGPAAAFGVAANAKAHLAVALSRTRQVLFVTATDVTAAQLHEAAGLFGARAELFLPRETPLVYVHAVSGEQRSERISALCALAAGETCVVCASAASLMQVLAPKQAFCESIFSLSVGDSLEPRTLTERLVVAGYERVELVEGRGQIAARGDLVDVYVPGGEYPVRIEFFGDEIDQMRFFDPVTQRSVEQASSVQLRPALETPQPKERTAKALKKIAGRVGLMDQEQAWSEGVASVGGDVLLPLLYEKCETVFDYLAPDAVIIVDEALLVDEALRTVDNPVDQLRTYVRLHLEYFSANHLPPGPTLRVLLPEAAAERLMEHVGILESRLYDIVRRGRERRYLRAEDIDATVAMIAACIGRAGSDATSAGSIREAVDAAEAFVLRAVDARVSADGTPRRIPRR